MAFADDIKATLRAIRDIPGQYGLRPSRVFLVSRFWSSGTPGVGGMYDSEEELLELAQPPKVRVLSDERRALGNMPGGSVEVGPITAPSSDADPATKILGRALSDKDRFFVRLSGPLAGLYRIESIKPDKAMHWMMILVPMESTDVA